MIPFDTTKSAGKEMSTTIMNIRASDETEAEVEA